MPNCYYRNIKDVGCSIVFHCYSKYWWSSIADERRQKISLFAKFYHSTALKQKFFDKDVSEGKKYSSYLAFDNGSIFHIYGKSFSWKHFMTSSDTFKMANEWVQKRIVNYAVYINAMSTDNFIRKYCKYFQSFNFKHRRNILKHRNKETIWDIVYLICIKHI